MSDVILKRGALRQVSTRSPHERELRAALLATWRTSSRVTSFFVENLPEELLDRKLPGAPRRTLRMLAGHLHNARCMWIKMLGRRHGLAAPESVARHSVTRGELLRALARSDRGMLRLIELGLDRGGRLAGFPPDVTHFVAYIIAHEAHHRGQICLLARQLGRRLPGEVTAGLWQWSRRSKEAR